MEATRSQTFAIPSQEQQLAHLRETLKDLPTVESLQLLLPSAPPLENAYEDQNVQVSFNGPAVPSAPPMEDSNQTDIQYPSRPSQLRVYPSLRTRRTSDAKLFKPQAVSLINNNNNNFTTEPTRFTYEDSMPHPTAYYTYEGCTAQSRPTWPEGLESMNGNQKNGDRYAPEINIPLYEYETYCNKKYPNLKGPRTLEIFHMDNEEVRKYSDEKQIHHMEFTQDGQRLKQYVPSSQPQRLTQKETTWICSTPRDSKRKSRFSRLSQKLKNLFRIGGGKSTVFSKELENLHGPSHNYDGFKDLMVLDQNEIDRVGEIGAQINDNAVFHLAFKMVYDYNKALPRKFRDKNHVQLVHPSFLQMFLDHKMPEILPEMTAFSSEQPCSRYLIPFLRGNHFALMHIGKVEGVYHLHVFDSLRPIEKGIPPVISNEELRKLARLLGNGDVRTKITRVPEQHTSMQSSAESNDCGICTVENVHACLQYKDFPLDTALYENRKVPDHITTLNRRSFKDQLQNWIGNNNNTNSEDCIDAPSTSSTKQFSITFARSQRKRKSAEPETNETCSTSAWNRQKVKKEKQRVAVQNCRLESAKIEALNSDNGATIGEKLELDQFSVPGEVVEAQTELDLLSDSEHIEASVTNDFDSEKDTALRSTDIVSHKKEMKTMRGSTEKQQTAADKDNRILSTVDSMTTPSVSRTSDDAMLGSLLMQLDGCLESVQDRAARHLLKEFKDKLSARLEEMDQNTSTSDGTEDVTLSDYEIEDEDTIFDPNFWTEKRKENLIDSYDTKVQIARIRKCVTSKKWKKKEAHYQLAKRVSKMMEYRDEQRNDIHESDIRRLGFEQSICWGLKDFKASRKFVSNIKDQCALVSRHVDGRLSKRALLRQNDIEKSIVDFRNNEVSRIRNQYALDHIFNVDQTGVVLEETRKRTLTKKGTPKVTRLCQRDNATSHSVTYNPCISGAGKLTGKLFLTLHEPSPPRSFGQMVAPFTNLHVTHSKSGKMSARLAEEWMEKCLLPNIPDRSVLLLDSWTGFNSMKLLRSVARKKLEIVTFPPRTTSELQPLDLFFNRQLKSFLRKLQDEIRLKNNTFTISIRNNLLKIASFTENQFEAPRFVPFIQRGFFELGIVTTRPPAFETPAEFCFNPAVAKKKCEGCRNQSFVKCAHCEKTYCIQCGLDHFH